MIFYNHHLFSSVSKFSKATISRGRDLVEKRSTFLKLKKNCYEYKNEENVLFKIIIDENDLKNSKKTFCACPQFQSKAFCKHIVMICIIHNINLEGIEPVKKFSMRKAQRYKKYATKALCM